MAFIPYADLKQISSQFRELANVCRALSRGNEDECLALVDVIEQTRLKWLLSYNECHRLKREVETLNSDAEAKNAAVKELKTQLTDARAQIASLVEMKKNIEAERVELEQQVDLVRQLLKVDGQYITEESMRKLDFLREKPTTRHGQRESGTSEEDEVDYDHTEESMGEEEEVAKKKRVGKSSSGRGRKRRSRSASRPPAIAEEEEFQPRKRSREESPKKTEKVVATATVTIPTDGGPPSANLRLRRSFSESHIPLDTPSPYTPGATLRRPLRSPGLRSWVSSGSLITTRPHLFATSRVLKPETCDYCLKRTPFGKNVYKCQDCRYTCHLECGELAPMPCVPRAPTTPARGARRWGLADLVPVSLPMIPSLIIHCVTELERRGALHTLGLYRVPGTEKDITDLLCRFVEERGTPNLRLVDDDHVLTGCIKRLLASLKDPLIPLTSWDEFVQAATMSCAPEERFQQLDAIISDLPQPNRDTLAFLMIHWIKVMMNHELNKMPLENLSMVLGPTVVGYSSDAPTPQQALNDTPKQAQVMKALFQLPDDYWREFLKWDAQPLVPSSAHSTTTPRYKQLRFDSLYPTLPALTPQPMPSARIEPLGTPKSLKAGRHFFQPPWK